MFSLNPSFLKHGGVTLRSLRVLKCSPTEYGGENGKWKEAEEVELPISFQAVQHYIFICLSIGVSVRFDWKKG